MMKQYKVAAMQASPVFLDLDATVEKGVKLIEEAARNGAQVVVFPEAFFPGYPYWIWLGEPAPYGLPFFERLYENSLEVPSPAIARLAKAARDNNIYVCASGTEKDRGSLYLTQFWFDRCGNLMGKHRKIKPTGVERTIWGEGDGSMMQVFPTELGNLGGLMCWEHLMAVNHVVMDSLNEQVHAASWPAFAWDEASVHHYDTAEAASKIYAITTGTFVVLSSEVLSQDTIDIMCAGQKDEEYKRSIYKAGQACPARIINPQGKIVSGDLLTHDEEGIVYGEVNLDELADIKYHIDTAGHYSNPAVSRVIFDRRPMEMVTIIGNQIDYSMPYNELDSEGSE
ncbi:MAG: carbon-nitrogen hydrolase family protein [Eggerthellaceae bacterium]